MIIVHGIDQAARVPKSFEHLRWPRHPKYSQFAGLAIDGRGGVLSILREAGETDGPLLLATLTQATESPRTWYQTGNPLVFDELWSAPFWLMSDGGNAPFRQLDLVTEICAEFGVSEPRWNSGAQWGLPDAVMPQNRWFRIPFSDLTKFLEDRLTRSPLIGLGKAAARPADLRGERIYVSSLVEHPGWLKLGMADKGSSPLSRMQAQQCCNWRRFHHLRVWNVRAAGSALRSIETAFKRELARMALARRSEWFRVDNREIALEKLDRFALANGFSMEMRGTME